MASTQLVLYLAFFAYYCNANTINIKKILEQQHGSEADTTATINTAISKEHFDNVDHSNMASGLVDPPISGAGKNATGGFFSPEEINPLAQLSLKLSPFHGYTADSRGNRTRRSPMTVDRELRRSGQSLCQPGSWYCGHQLLEMGYTSVNGILENELFECDNERDGILHVGCSPTSCIGGPNVQAYCACEIGKRYCGYMLRAMHFVFDTLNDHNIYKCTKESNVDTLVSNCTNGCSPRADKCYSRPPPNCIAGTRACGLLLGALKYNNWKSGVLYECNEDNSGNVKKLETCISGCAIGNEKTDFSSRCLYGNYAKRPY